MNQPNPFGIAIVVAAALLGYLLPHPAPKVLPPVAVVAVAPAPSAAAIPNAPSVTSPTRAALYRATLAQVAKDFGIQGRLDCRVVPK